MKGIGGNKILIERVLLAKVDFSNRIVGWICRLRLWQQVGLFLYAWPD